MARRGRWRPTTLLGKVARWVVHGLLCLGWIMAVSGSLLGGAVVAAVGGLVLVAAGVVVLVVVPDRIERFTGLGVGSSQGGGWVGGDGFG